MTFTDEDLKRLKQDLEHNYYPGEIERVQALLARLEAAEKVANNCNCLSYSRARWRKASGKDLK